MAKKSPPKKGPGHVTSARKPESRGDILDRELEIEVNAFTQKVQNAIEEARGKMTEADREKADREAKIILDRASAAAKSSRHTA
jgi:hypothetical protein